MQHGLFVVEGIKTIQELLRSSLELNQLYTTRPFNFDAKKELLISEAELKRISFLKSPNTALAVFKIPEPKPIDASQLIVALDDVRDPGNLGTIIRLCDWFGVNHLVCSQETVDCFNPKVIQATMGSITRVNVTYLDLEAFLKTTPVTSFGTFMEGSPIYDSTLPTNGIIVFGNEANGISSVVESLVDEKLSIPRFGNLQATESLNVATAMAIVLSEFRRR